jgi:hypothetical protein
MRDRFGGVGIFSVEEIPIEGRQSDKSHRPSADHCHVVPLIVEERDGHFNCDEIDENVVWSFVPMPFTTAMMATEMPAAIKPYSMAVAPDSSFRKALSFVTMP